MGIKYIGRTGRLKVLKNVSLLFIKSERSHIRAIKIQNEKGIQSIL